MLDTVKAALPPPLKRAIKAQLQSVYKIWLFGRDASLVPAADDMFDGPPSVGVFKANGEEFLAIYKDLCGLKPDERMLDVGCGIGRKTLPLTKYLSAAATYDGIDITAAGIEWCARKITPRFPNFRFQHIDVYNKHYNPQGRRQAADYTFPFADESFDFAMLGSVFTHMLPDDLLNYLSEVRRVLRTGGRCLITYFLLNEESLALIAEGRSTLGFRPRDGVCRVISDEVPEMAVAYDEAWIEGAYRDRGLSITRLERGSWCGRKEFLSYQDQMLAVRR